MHKECVFEEEIFIDGPVKGDKDDEGTDPSDVQGEVERWDC